MLNQLLLVLFVTSVCQALYYSANQPSMVRSAQNRQAAEPCGPCDRSKCYNVSDCNAGMVEDRCSCCMICGVEESHLCNTEREIRMIVNGMSDSVWHGRCGEGLECRVRTDVDSKLAGRQSICYCKHSGLVCGSDGSSYSSCQLMAKNVLLGGKIQQIADGPCETKPTIELNAPNTSIQKKAKVTLICEVHGFPKPDITWDFMEPNAVGRPISMPSNSDDVVVCRRGSNSKTKFTSYLQITGFSLKHEGVYRCIAKNKKGTTTKSASLVLDS